MKLLMATHFFESHRGGIEIVAGRLAREFARTGIEVTWLATDASPPPDATCEPRLHPIALTASNVAERLVGIPYPLPTPSSFARILHEVAAADAVLVHDALYLTSIAAFLAARWSGKPVVVVQHIGAVPYKNPFLRWAMKIANRLIASPILARSDQTVFISESTARHFGGLKFRAEPDLIFNGVDSTVFSPPTGPEQIAAARRDLGLPAEAAIALFVGRFVEKKGLAVLERLAAARPDIMFAFAGWGPLDPRAWNLANVRVFDTLAGPTLATLYRACDALILPSIGEGFPLVVQEALACGMQILCGDETAQADEGVSSVVTGLAVDLNDIDRTASRFEHALAACLQGGRDNDARRSAAAFARARYSWPRAAVRYGEILTRVSSSANGPLPPAHAAGRTSPLRGGA
jgi:glycosyltransferase involved in cell wall biosynthesis